MNKYDLVLDIIGHPEKYSPEQLREILDDPETREIYNLLCMTDSAAKADGTPADVDAEWQRFSQANISKPRHRFLTWFGSRAASIAAIIGISVAAVAAGIAVTVSVADHKAEEKTELHTVESAAMQSSSDAVAEAEALPSDTVVAEIAPIMFEDEALEVIMNKVAAIYGVEISFNNADAAGLHLFYRLDPTLPVEQIISQLNTFEQINIRRDGDTLIID